MPTGRRLTESQVREIRELFSVGIATKAIAKKFGISTSPVLKIKRDPKITGVPDIAPQAMTPVTKTPEARTSKYNHLEPQIQELRSQGLGVKAVAKKLGIPHTTVNYYFYGKKKYHKPAKVKAKEKALAAKALNGNPTATEATNGHKHLDTRFLIGFGCAELERTARSIAERLGINAELLRQGFSKFVSS